MPLLQRNNQIEYFQMYEIHSVAHGPALSFLSLCDLSQLSTGTWNISALPWGDCSFLGCHSVPSPSHPPACRDRRARGLTKLLVTRCNGQWHYCLKENTNAFTSLISCYCFPSSAFTLLGCIPHIWEQTPEVNFASGTWHKKTEFLLFGIKMTKAKFQVHLSQMKTCSSSFALSRGDWSFIKKWPGRIKHSGRKIAVSPGAVEV